MSEEKCTHRWEVADLRNGYLVVEGCFHCGGRLSFFSAEPVPPVDEYREGEHFWAYMGGYQASRFNLACRKCDEKRELSEVMALMMCMACDPECEVAKLMKREAGKVWAYVALCANTSHEKHCVPQEQVEALTEYYNQSRSPGGKRIVVLPCQMRKSADKCHGIILADTGLTELY